MYVFSNCAVCVVVYKYMHMAAHLSAGLVCLCLVNGDVSKIRAGAMPTGHGRC